MKRILSCLIAVVALCTALCFAADVAQPTPNSVILTDFEDFPVMVRDSVEITDDQQDLVIQPKDLMWFVYSDKSSGRKSQMVTSIVNDAAHGSKAMKLSWKLDNYCGMGISTEKSLPSTNPIWDWSKAKSISFYVKGTPGQTTFFSIGVGDKDDERYRSTEKFKVEGDQWQKIVCPMASMKARTDWQPRGIKRNFKFDAPGTLVEFIPYSETGDITIDFFEINN
ncbi:MAG TPA: carbohydrate binding domain-containing protein [Bacillota bacterium]|nr:carbohydrate binding domain-containing protein [Bacillota bacterium]